MRSILKNHDFDLGDLGDLLIAACLVTIFLGMFFF